MEAVLMFLFLGTGGQEAVGPQVLNEGGFVYSQVEGERCGQELLILNQAKQTNSGGQLAEVMRDRFRRCILAYRQMFREQQQRREREEAERAEQAARRAQEERERKKRDDDLLAAAARDAEEVEKILANPKAVHALLSASLCWGTHERADVLAKIAKDRKYSNIGGVVDLERRAELQDRLQEVDDFVESVRVALKATKKQPLSCKDPGIQELEPCLDPAIPVAECSGDSIEATKQMQILVRAARAAVANR